VIIPRPCLLWKRRVAESPRTYVHGLTMTETILRGRERARQNATLVPGCLPILIVNARLDRRPCTRFFSSVWEIPNQRSPDPLEILIRRTRA
jgi:hypothetical protein